MMLEGCGDMAGGWQQMGVVTGGCLGGQKVVVGGRKFQQNPSMEKRRERERKEPW